VVDVRGGIESIGLGLKYVVIDLVAAFCSRVRRNMDFQQANGRRVCVVGAMVVWGEILRLRFDFLEVRHEKLGPHPGKHFSLELRQLQHYTTTTAKLNLSSTTTP
jgi:hypothetical protein